jgi:hypothetical protein
MDPESSCWKNKYFLMVMSDDDQKEWRFRKQRTGGYLCGTNYKVNIKNVKVYFIEIITIKCIIYAIILFIVIFKLLFELRDDENINK